MSFESFSEAGNHLKCHCNEEGLQSWRSSSTSSCAWHFLLFDLDTLCHDKESLWNPGTCCPTHPCSLRSLWMQRVSRSKIPGARLFVWSPLSPWCIEKVSGRLPVLEVLETSWNATGERSNSGADVDQDLCKWMFIRKDVPIEIDTSPLSSWSPCGQGLLKTSVQSDWRFWWHSRRPADGAWSDYPTCLGAFRKSWDRHSGTVSHFRYLYVGIMHL